MASIQVKRLKDRKAYYVVYSMGNNKVWRKAGYDRETALKIKNEVEKMLINKEYGLLMYKAIPFATYVKDYWYATKFGGKPLRERTIAEYKIQGKILMDYFGNTPIDKISTDDIIKFKNYRYTQVGGRAVNYALLTLRQILEHAFTFDYIKRSPYLPKLIGKYQERVIQRFLTNAEVETLMDKASVWTKHIIFIVLNTGFRHNELSNFHFDDIDYQNNVIHVRPEVSKNKTSRYIPISASLKEVLLFLANNWINPINSVVYKRKPCQKTYVLCNAKGRKTGSFVHTIQKLVRTTGIKECTLHTFRKTFASRLVQAGIPLYVVSQILGHGDTKVTEKHYAFLANKNFQDAIKLLENTTTVRI
jgi:integrase